MATVLNLDSWWEPSNVDDNLDLIQYNLVKLSNGWLVKVHATHHTQNHFNA